VETSVRARGLPMQTNVVRSARLAGYVRTSLQGTV
jgi:hypothetical protein